MRAVDPAEQTSAFLYPPFLPATTDRQVRFTINSAAVILADWRYNRAMDRTEPVEIVPSRDGPYLVRGPVRMRDQQGRVITLTRRTIALCRCGRSRVRPFCDGTHQQIGFTAPSGLEAPATSAVEGPASAEQDA
jgi:CDGSH-type Zn-finger protein